LLHKNTPYIWTTECQQSFEQLKQIATTAPVLGAPKLDKGPFIVTTDASIQGIACQVVQEQDGQEVPISFWSKTLNDTQRNYCITHLELLVAVEGILAHDYLLAGAPFVVRTDHYALK